MPDAGQPDERCANYASLAEYQQHGVRYYVRLYWPRPVRTIRPSSYSESPSETGQPQFAAIAEIVTLLSDTPNTNWEQVALSRTAVMGSAKMLRSIAYVRYKEAGPSVAIVRDCPVWVENGL